MPPRKSGSVRMTRSQTHVFVHGSAPTGLSPAGRPVLGSGSRESSPGALGVFALPARARPLRRFTAR